MADASAPIVPVDLDVALGEVAGVHAALFKGGFLLLFGLWVLVEIAVKISTGVPPSTPLMLMFGSIALLANLICLSLLWRFRKQDLNMSSTFECSRNDVIANVGVLIAAVGVVAFASPWPDIIVAAIIATLFLRSAFNVIGRAWPQFRSASNRPSRGYQGETILT